jgi:hypothetical protein
MSTETARLFYRANGYVENGSPIIEFDVASYPMLKPLGVKKNDFCTCPPRGWFSARAQGPLLSSFCGTAAAPQSAEIHSATERSGREPGAERAGCGRPLWKIPRDRQPFGHATLFDPRALIGQLGEVSFDDAERSCDVANGGRFGHSSCRKTSHGNDAPAVITTPRALRLKGAGVRSR